MKHISNTMRENDRNISRCSTCKLQISPPKDVHPIFAFLKEEREKGRPEVFNVREAREARVRGGVCGSLAEDACCVLTAGSLRAFEHGL